MELARIFLLGALFLIAFMLWNAWQNEYPNSQAIKIATPTEQRQVAKELKKLPRIPGSANKQQATKAGEQRFIHVKTDVLDVLIDTFGGNIVQAKLLQYAEQATNPHSPAFQLLSKNPDSYYIAQSGLIDP